MNDVAALLNAKTRPIKQHKADFYKKIAAVARICIENPQLGLSPAKEIARRARVSENLAHQWIYKARKLGFLEPSQRSAQRLHHHASD
jgi:hypothetical protein